MAPVYALNCLGEVGGGALVLLGLLTPLGAMLGLGDMLVALFQVAIHKGFFAAAGGYELNLLLMVGLVSVLLIGAGAYSLDYVVLRRPATKASVAAAASP